MSVITESSVDGEGVLYVYISVKFLSVNLEYTPYFMTSVVYLNFMTFTLIVIKGVKGLGTFYYDLRYKCDVLILYDSFLKV